MTGSRVLLELVIVLGTAAVATLLFGLLRLPAVLGYIVAGLVIGPHVSVPLVADAHLVHTLSELGVILLMFALGLELRLSTLARVGVGAGLTAVFEVGLVLTAGALVAGALGFGAGEAVFAGACLAISSTMLVAKAFEQLGWKGGFTDVVFAILVFEDLIAVLLLAVLTGLASGHGLAPAELAIMVAKLVGFLVALVVGGLLVVPRLMRALVARHHPEPITIVALALCFGLAAISDRVGYPVALGAFVAGLVIAESGHGHHVLDLVRPFRDVFAMTFFVSIGMTIKPAELVSELPTIAAFTAVVLVVKPLAVAAGGFATGRGLQPAIRAGVSLAQVGELSFVIAALGAGSGVARPSLLAIAVGVACATTLTSALTIPASEAIARRVGAGLPARLATFVSFYEAWLGRLGSRRDTAWQRVRRPTVVLIVDAAAVIAIAIGGAVEGDRLRLLLGLHGRAGDAILLAVIVAAAAPFALGVIRRVVQIARALALLVIPAGAAVDLGLAPRRALTLTLELALAAVIATAMVAAVQPFVGAGALVVGGAILAMVAVTYRAIVDFGQHVRAGSELILELLHQPVEQRPAVAELDGLLPGFGGLVTLTIADRALAVGRTLAELDLRARTGATVLALARGAGGFASPTPTEPLRAGDVLALTGSDAALAAARLVLDQIDPLDPIDPLAPIAGGAGPAPVDPRVDS